MYRLYIKIINFNTLKDNDFDHSYDGSYIKYFLGRMYLNCQIVDQDINKSIWVYNNTSAHFNFVFNLKIIFIILVK